MWSANMRRMAPALPGALAGFAGLSSFNSSSSKAKVFCQEASFSKSEFRSFPVLEVRDAGPGTKILKCKLPSSQHVMGMTVSSLVMVNGGKGEDDKVPSRPYTPITTDDQAGYFELLVKGYEQGVVSKYLISLKAGDSVEIKGPFPKLPYTANMKKSIGMVAGGSGVTPMLQDIK
jgi:cytochrome-b5 reductase